MEAVIIAAGAGSRLAGESEDLPKTLLPYGNGNILSCIMTNLRRAGVSRFVVVVGYQAQLIRDFLQDHNGLGFAVTVVENPAWTKGNARSVLAAQRSLDGDEFILSMSDHLVSAEAMKRLRSHPSRRNLLLVDPYIERVFDIDDATKVQCQQTKICAIGKELVSFNGVDCGVFRLNDHFFDAIRRSIASGDDSISAAARLLIEQDDLEAVFMERSENWIDIDTPEAYRYCLKHMKL